MADMPILKAGENEKTCTNAHIKKTKSEKQGTARKPNYESPYRKEIRRKEREKVANRKRSKQLKIYLSDEEHQTFIEQVEKLKLSQTDFFIKCITKKKIIVVDGLKETLTELKKIGVNINQISKNLNSGIFQNADKELKAVKEEFVKVNDTMLALLKGVK